MTVSQAPVFPILSSRFVTALEDLEAKPSTNSTSASIRSFLALVPACRTHCLCAIESKGLSSFIDLASTTLASEEP